MEKIKELCSEERPYEKCERFGAKHLTDIELLAVLLRSGSRGESALQLARHILYPSLLPGGILNIHNWSYEQLRKIRGIGKVKAIQILCLSELAKRLLLLNTKSRLLGESDISKGTVNASIVSPRELFVEALQKNAVYIILLHNHPSGDPSPSREDILVTQRIHDAGEMIGIELLDHIIIGDNRYVSLREEGVIQ